MEQFLKLGVLPRDLRRILLLGGDGLDPAYGPINSFMRGAWDPVAGVVREDTGRKTYDPIDYRREPPGLPWIPLDPPSPWPARMALVTAYLLLRGQHTPPLRCACVTEIDDDGQVGLYWVEGCGVEMIHWNTRTGECDQLVAEDEDDQPDDLPTLPNHLKTQPLVAALMLAAWDEWSPK